MSDLPVIAAGARQDPQQFMRFILRLAQGDPVRPDTSGRTYAVRVTDATYQRWLAELPAEPAPPAGGDQDPPPVQTPKKQAPTSAKKRTKRGA